MAELKVPRLPHTATGGRYFELMHGDSATSTLGRSCHAPHPGLVHLIRRGGRLALADCAWWRCRTLGHDSLGGTAYSSCLPGFGTLQCRHSTCYKTCGRRREERCGEGVRCRGADQQHNSDGRAIGTARQPETRRGKRGTDSKPLASALARNVIARPPRSKQFQHTAVACARHTHHSDDVMTSAAGKRTAPIHKKTYFGASRTWDTWNKLTASDVFALTEEPGFEGSVLPLVTV